AHLPLPAFPTRRSSDLRHHRQMNLDFSFTDLSGTFSVMDVLLSLLLAFACSLVVAWVYRATHLNVSYSQSYVQTLIILGMLIALIMLIEIGRASCRESMESRVGVGG